MEAHLAAPKKDPLPCLGKALKLHIKLLIITTQLKFNSYLINFENSTLASTFVASVKGKTAYKGINNYY